MDFDPTARQSRLVELATEIASVHCSEQAEAERDSAGGFPRHLLQALGRAGIFSVWRQPPHGHGFLDACLIQEALSRASSTAAGMLFLNSAAISMMQRGKIGPGLQPILDAGFAGDALFAFSLTEPNAGSDASAIGTSAVLDSDGFVVNGHKLYTTGAMDADYIMVVARTASEGPARNASSLILIPGDAAGLEKRVLRKVAGNALATCEVFLRDVRVPGSSIVGPLNGAWGLLHWGGLVERLLVAAMSVGIARRALDGVIAVLSERTQFGQAITQFQAVRHRLADMAAQIEAMRCMTWRAAWLADEGRDCATEVNMAKLFASEGAATISAEAMRLSGGRGYFVEDRLNRTWRESALALFAGGTSEIQRNGIARGLGL